MRKNEHSLRDLWDTIKYITIYIIGVSGKKREKEREKIIFEEIMAKFLKFDKNINLHIQEV